MILLRLAFQSLRSRMLTTALTSVSIALSVMLLVGVQAVQQGAKKGFQGTLSHVDLVVGARGGSLPLLLYSVFHIGTANNDIAYASYEHFSKHPAVLWTIPFSLGDSFHDFRVVATDDNFYEHYQYRGGQHIRLGQGRRAEGIFDAVMGSEAARRLHDTVGSQLVLTHGIEGSFIEHANRPFTVVGVLAPTGTPVDRAIYITLYGDEAMHLGWEHGAAPLDEKPASQIRKEDLHIKQVSAFLLATRSRISTLLLQREINTYTSEPLTAIVPALTLEDLWSVMSYADVALSVVSGAVLIVGLLAMIIALYTALNERRREVAILRAIGLHAYQVFTLFMLEALIISLSGVLAGLALVYLVIGALRPFAESHYGIPLAPVGLDSTILIYAAIIIGAGVLVGCVPAYRAYRNALVDGLAVS